MMSLTASEAASNITALGFHVRLYTVLSAQPKTLAWRRTSKSKGH